MNTYDEWNREPEPEWAVQEPGTPSQEATQELVQSMVQQQVLQVDFAALVPPDIQGWFAHWEPMLKMIEANRFTRCVEVGTWLGKSAIAVARLIALWGGTLVCVDHWRGSASFPEELRPKIPASYTTFLKYLRRYKIKNVTTIREASPAAARHVSDGSVDFIYLDASHDGDSVRADLDAWWPKLRSGGIIAGDDYGDERFWGLMEAWDARDGVMHEHGPQQPGLVWIQKV